MDLSVINIPAVLWSVCISVYFIFAIYLAWYIPGNLITKKLISFENKPVTDIVSFGVGLIIWTYQGALFGYVRLQWMSWVYILAACSIWVYTYVRGRWKLRIKRLTIKQIVLVVIFVIGVFGQVNRFVPSGFIFPGGIYMLTGASDDAFWHLSLTNQIARQFPPNEPGLSGVAVRNYHYWSNIAAGELVRVFHLPVLATQFFYTYIAISLLLGGLSYVLVKELRFSTLGVFVALYLQYFASDIIYLTSFIAKGTFEFGVHPLEDGTMFLENPPRAYAAIAVLTGLILLRRWLMKKKLLLGMLTALVLASTVGFKIHTGIMTIGGLACLGIYLAYKRQWNYVYVPFVAILAAVVIYYPVNSASGLPVFAPFEMSRMFTVQEKLGISVFELRRRIYQEHANIVRVFQMDITMLVIFLLSQFGLRNIGWVSIRTAIRNVGVPLTVYIYGGLVLTTLFGTLFIQPVAYADIFNSYLAGSILLWVLASISINTWLGKTKRLYRILFIFLIISFTIPRWIYKTSIEVSTLQSLKPVIYKEELDAMNFIKAKTPSDSTILVFNQGQWDSVFPYVSVFTNRDTFLSGQGILERHGIDMADRKKIVESIQADAPPAVLRKIVLEHNIGILYFYSKPSIKKYEELFDTIFSNDMVTLYRVKSL